MKNNNISFFNFVWSHIKNFKIAFLLMLVLSGFIALERIYIPNLMGKIIDILGGIEAKEKIYVWNSIGKYAIYGLVAMLSIDVLFRIQEVIFEKIMPKFAASIRFSAYEKTLHHSAKFFSNEYSGDVGSKINDLAQYIFYMLSRIVNIFSPIFLTVFTGIISVFFINKTLGAIYFLWLVAHIGITVLTASFIGKYYKNAAGKLNFLKGKIIDGINNVLNIRLFSEQKNEIEYMQKFQNEEIDASFQAGLKGIFVRTFLSFTTILGLIFVFFQSISLWQKDLITIGQLNAVLFILLNTILMVWWFSYEFILFITDIGKAKASFVIFETEIEIQENEKNPDIEITNGKIEFENVCFSHSSQAFFENKNIVIKSKEKIGLVGYSGSGKTTFANLILREFDIQDGKILIDDQDVTLFNLKSLRSQITYITQNVLLFHRTIRENLLFAKKDATEEELIAACKAADCFDLIKNLEHGFDTDIGEQGSKLSGGQKQRISIARGILKGSKIVILDEATSALDSITEKRIQKALDALSKGKTTIVIAHRLSTLRNVDRIFVFEAGKIIEIGSHDELLKLNGFYSKLYTKQFSNSEDDNLEENEL